jgi:hypothetical protein
MFKPKGGPVLLPYQKIAECRRKEAGEKTIEQGLGSVSGVLCFANGS